MPDEYNVDNVDEGGDDDDGEEDGKEGEHECVQCNDETVTVVMTLMKISLIMRMVLILILTLILILMKCLPGLGTERVVGTMVSRAIVKKSLKNKIVSSEKSSLQNHAPIQVQQRPFSFFSISPMSQSHNRGHVNMSELTQVPRQPCLKSYYMSTSSI